MGNLCSIFHSRFKNLIKVIPSARKAQLMDYILLCWQKSTYQLKNSDKKWFMKPHDEIVADTGIRLGTIRDYLKQLEDEGFIERRQARYNRKSANGEYHVTMGGYINVTDKFLHLLNAGEHIHSPSNNSEDTNNNPSKQPAEDDNIKPTSSISDINQIIDPLKTGESYIRDLRISFNNNIKFKNLIHSVDKPTLERLICQYETINTFMNTQIHEEISDEVKKLVLGTFFNLTFEHKKHFSDPKQIVAEYLFSLINTQFCLPLVTDFNHRNAILAKIIRKNVWRTPKGFYSHFYLGQDFKDKNELRQKRIEEDKQRELERHVNEPASEQDQRSVCIETAISKQVELIDELNQRLREERSEDGILMIREQIQRVKHKLHDLWDEQRMLEIEIERASSKNVRLCA